MTARDRETLEAVKQSGASRIVRFPRSRTGRLICISDIHGYDRLFSTLLRRLQLREDDQLVLLGDYVERGPENRRVLRRIRALAARPNTLLLQGNNDLVPRWLLEKAETGEALHYLGQYPQCLLGEWMAELGWTGSRLPDEKTFSCYRRAILRNHAEAMEFLASLPLMAETDEFVFVHAALEDRPDWQNSGEEVCLTFSRYLQEGVNPTGKWVVTGHWPTYNILPEAFRDRETLPGLPPEEGKGTSCHPVAFSDQWIVGIDGGLGTKSFPQLNALCVAPDGGVTVLFEDGAPSAVALRDAPHPSSGQRMRDDWPNNRLEILETGRYFSLCRREGWPYTGLVKNEHIGVWKGRPAYDKGSTSHFLSVREGERLHVLDDACEGFAYVRNESGVMGWLEKDAFRRTSSVLQERREDGEE